MVYEIGKGSTEHFYMRAVFGSEHVFFTHFTKWQLNSREHYDKSILGREGIYPWQFSSAILSERCRGQRRKTHPQSEKSHMGMGRNQNLPCFFWKNSSIKPEIWEYHAATRVFDS